MPSVPLVSVIVPCYNATAYLKRCVDSVLAQTMPDFELILIDDCSTDGTYALMQQLAAADTRIELRQTVANGGPGATRNVGIETARGRYLLFADNDDALLPNCLQVACQTAVNYGADMVGYGIYKVDETGQNPVPKHWHFQNVPGGWEAVHLLESGRDLGPWTYAMLLAREVTVRHNLRFPAICYEDLVFKFKALYHARRFVNIPDDLYLNYFRPDATSSLTVHKRHYSQVEAYTVILDYISEWFSALRQSGADVPEREEMAAYNYFLAFSMCFMSELRENIGNAAFAPLFDEYARREFGRKYAYIKTLTAMYQWQSEEIMSADKNLAEQAALIEFYESAAPYLRSFHRRQEIANAILHLSAEEWENIGHMAWYTEYWSLVRQPQQYNETIKNKATAFADKISAVMRTHSNALLRQKALVAIMLYRSAREVIPHIEPELWPEQLRADFIRTFG